jgi:hypothetical protein
MDWTTQMSVHRKGKRGEATPVIVVGVVAAVGIATILFKDFGPGSNSLGSGDGMITASALARAGAFALPTEPPVQLAIPKTVSVSEPLRH